MECGYIAKTGRNLKIHERRKHANPGKTIDEELKVREPGTLSIFRNSKAHFEQNHAIFCRENFA